MLILQSIKMGINFKNIAYKLEQKCSAIYFPSCWQKKKNIRILMIPNERDI